MIIRSKYILIALALLFTATQFGCKRENDFYIDPNKPEKVTPSLLFSSLGIATINIMESSIVKNSTIWVQHNTGVSEQSLQVNRYIFTETDYDNHWIQLYKNLFSWKDLQSKYSEDYPYYVGMGNILAAMNLVLLTDMWGDVPFSEALQGQKNYEPKYDTQEEVLKNVIALLEEGIAKLQMPEDANASLPSKADDIFYDGDKELWIKLANTLKARYLNRLSNKSSYNPQAILDALKNGISSTTEDLVAKHGLGTKEANQWYDFQNSRRRYILACATLVDEMKKRPSDLRLQYYFAATSATNEVVGSPVDNINSQASEWGRYLAESGATKVPLVTYAEAKFIEAEVLVRQGNDASDALNAAIKENCKQVTNGTYNGADIAIFTNANADLKNIMQEKWMALFGSAEPYNDYRRTNLPALTPNANGVIKTIPQRLLTPLAERTTNTNAPAVTVTMPVWYAQP